MIKSRYPSGRPRGVTCAYPLGCRKAARVRCTLEFTGEYSRRQVVYRCWVHYVELENAARQSDVFNVVHAKLCGRRPR